MRASEIMEAHRAPLFHTTQRLGLAYILATNKLDAKTTDTAMVVPRDQSGVSLTRSYEFARRYKSAARRGLPTLVLDATNIRTKPVSYWNGRINDDWKPDEMEEWHAGPILNISRYLLSINSSVPFESWLAHVHEGLTSFMHDKDMCRFYPVKEALAMDFTQFRPLWNRWQPVRGMAA